MPVTLKNPPRSSIAWSVGVQKSRQVFGGLGGSPGASCHKDCNHVLPGGPTTMSCPRDRRVGEQAPLSSPE